MSYDSRPPPYRYEQHGPVGYDPHNAILQRLPFGTIPGPSSSTLHPVTSAPSPSPAIPFVPRAFQSWGSSYHVDTASASASASTSTASYTSRPSGLVGVPHVWTRSSPQSHQQPHSHRAQPYPSQPHERYLERPAGKQGRARGATGSSKQRALKRQRNEANAQVEALQLRVAELEAELEKERELRLEAERAAEEEFEEEEKEPQAVQTEEEREWAAGQGIWEMFQEMGRAERGLDRILAAHEAARSHG
ncbi:hypothetical protein JCM8208_002366 [Rhodotorula glutinis]